MSEKCMTYVCGKKREQLNVTNWNRHLDNCKVRKTKISSRPISSFFPTPKKVEINARTNNSSSNVVKPYFDSTSSSVCKEIDDKSKLKCRWIDSTKLCSEESTNSSVYKEIESVDNESNSISTSTNHCSDYSVEDLNLNMNKDLHELNKFTNDPDLILQYVSSTLLSYLVDLGPCQPLPNELINNIFPVKTDSMGRSRSFHESYYYYKETANQLSTKRLWLSYSPSSDKIYCYSCKLFGLAKAKKSIMANGSYDWTNLNRNIKNHECSTEHLESEISRGLYQKNYRIDLHIMENANKNIAENREVLRVIIEIIIFSARQNIALRGHNEKLTSNNRGNFLELIELLSHHNAVLKIHLDKLKKKKQNKLTFLSHISQNKILKILGELVRCSILTKIKKAGLLSVIIDRTTDVANIEQFSFIIRFVNMHDDIEERLVTLEAAADGTGKGLFKKFCEITEKHNIDWKKNLCAQAYDGAAARARKRTVVFIECQHDLYPEERVRRIKSFSNTRWTSHDRIEAKQFCETHDLPERDFKIIRLKKRKRQIDENIEEVNLNSPYENYKISTYFMALDKIITSFTSRYSGAQNILKDLSLLSPERLIDIGKNTEQELPKNCFNYVTEWIDGICLANLKNEYKVFSTSVTSLHDGIKLLDSIHKVSIIDDKTMELNSDTLEISESEIDHNETELTCSKNTITVSSILHVLTSFDLVSAFLNLYLVYKALGTIPASSVKLVKTRLRSTMGDERLESLILMSCEKDIDIYIEEAINKFGCSSDLLKSHLMFK
ncbi:hypothetical protein AGLY_004559 [Aphis glycines]|uniref:DUF4371 domain-containing protein n=1 Tax=Aphis glycines TaxID=307491 RepID=A0A6G0TYX7_APHGL|nr:hypothetical protein AGLY_004559 [Aphis glycines]